MDGEKDKDTEVGGGEIQTSQYNKLRTNEYLHLRKRFYAKYPINHDCDFTFEDVVLDKLISIEYNLKTEELAHQETLKVWRELKESLIHVQNILKAAITQPNKIAIDWKEHLTLFIEESLKDPKLCICCEEITEENAHLHRNCGK